MTKYNLTLPKMGESVEEATIVNWLKNVGDKIKADDFVVEVATDKVDSEVPSDVEGVLVEKCFEIISEIAQKDWFVFTDQDLANIFWQDTCSL